MLRPDKEFFLDFIEKVYPNFNSGRKEMTTVQMQPGTQPDPVFILLKGTPHKLAIVGWRITDVDGKGNVVHPWKMHLLWPSGKVEKFTLTEKGVIKPKPKETQQRRRNQEKE